MRLSQIKIALVPRALPCTDVAQECQWALTYLTYKSGWGAGGCAQLGWWYSPGAGVALPLCYVMTPSDSAPAHVMVYVDHKYRHPSPAALMVLLNSSTA